MREEESSKSTKHVGLRHERGRELRKYQRHIRIEREREKERERECVCVSERERERRLR